MNVGVAVAVAHGDKVKGFVFTKVTPLAESDLNQSGVAVEAAGMAENLSGFRGDTETAVIPIWDTTNREDVKCAVENAAFVLGFDQEMSWVEASW